MMAVKLMIMMSCSIFSYTTVVSSNFIIESDIGAMIIMTIAAMSMNKIMAMKASFESKVWETRLMSLVGVLTLAAFFCKDKFIFLVLMEATMIPMSFIILHSSKDSDKKESLKFMIFMNTLGSIPFMIYILKSATNESFFSSFSMKSETMLLMMMILFVMKTPLFIAHLWLTKAHVSSSGNCSMILASIMIKLGTIGLMKFSKEMSSKSLMDLFFCFGVGSMLLMSLMMIRMFDIKTMIAMSSVLHMSMMLPFLMQHNSTSVIACMMMMVSHGVISYFLFYIITVSYETAENRTMIFTKSLESKDKILSLMMTIFLFLNLGVPPFMNFFSETLYMLSMAKNHYIVLTMMFMMVLLLNIIFTLQVLTSTNFHKTEMHSTKGCTSKISVAFLFYFFLSLMILKYL